LIDADCKETTKIAREKRKKMPDFWKSFTGELDRLYQTRENTVLLEDYLSDACFDLPTFRQATTK
jgi:hypothetical protein